MIQTFHRKFDLARAVQFVNRDSAQSIADLMNISPRDIGFDHHNGKLTNLKLPNPTGDSYFRIYIGDYVVKQDNAFKILSLFDMLSQWQVVPELPHKFFVFDIESVGLYGPGFAYGYVVIDKEGNEIDEGSSSVDPRTVGGEPEDLEWVLKNVEPNLAPRMRNDRTLPQLYDAFWDAMTIWMRHDAVPIADCCFPVETNFLRACVANRPSRQKDSPFPLRDVAYYMENAGYDPRGDYEREERELPAHNPLNDSRQSARKLLSVIGKR